MLFADTFLMLIRMPEDLLTTYFIEAAEALLAAAASADATSTAEPEAGERKEAEDD